MLPYARDAWIDQSKTKIGYEISFTKHFYKPVPLRTLDEIRADIRALEAESDNLIADRPLMFQDFRPYAQYDDARSWGGASALTLASHFHAGARSRGGGNRYA